MEVISTAQGMGDGLRPCGEMGIATITNSPHPLPLHSPPLLVTNLHIFSSDNCAGKCIYAIGGTSVIAKVRTK